MISQRYYSWKDKSLQVRPAWLSLYCVSPLVVTSHRILATRRVGGVGRTSYSFICVVIARLVSLSSVSVSVCPGARRIRCRSACFAFSIPVTRNLEAYLRDDNVFSVLGSFISDKCKQRSTLRATLDHLRDVGLFPFCYPIKT